MELARPRTPAHDAAAFWRDRCLLRDGSLFVDAPVWTGRGLDDLHRAFVQNPLLGSDSFMAKFQQQLTGAPTPVVWLAAEMLYVMNLFPSARAIGGDAKRGMVRNVWEWSGTPLPDSDLLKVLDSGIGHPGTAYLTRRDRELEYLIAVATDIKARHAQAEEILRDPWATARMLEQVQDGSRRLLRHILLNLLFPDVFEGIVSGRHRAQILNAFPDHLRDFDPLRGDTDLMMTDRAILHIRDRLESELGRMIDFYDEDIRARWEPTKGFSERDVDPPPEQDVSQRPLYPPREVMQQIVQEAADDIAARTTPPRAATLARLLHDYIGDRRLTLDDDRLQIAEDVRALSAVLVNRDGKPPISVGLFGDWGTGKSFFMELMHGYIEELAEASRDARTRGEPTAFCGHVVQIRFNAWHYMDSNLWASLATRVFEGLAEHVSQREEDPERAKQKLFDRLAESEGILSQVRAERNTATAELQAARNARTAAAADREAAAGDRAAAVRRRDDARAEQARLQQTIEDAASERKREEEKLGRSISVAVVAALDEARADTRVTAALDEASRALGIERDRLQVDDVRRMLRQMRGMGGRLRTLGMALGSPAQRRWRVGAIAWALASVALVAAAIRWLGGVEEAGAVTAAVLASAGTLVAAVERWMDRLSAGIGAVERANTAIQAKIDERTARFRAEEEAARQRLAELAETERRALADERAARDDERRALEAERTAREIEVTARGEERSAASAEQQARERVEAVKREIGELRAGRKLQSFIQERSGTADYRQHLGLVSTIRRDFEQLSRLLTGMHDQPAEEGLPHIERIILYIDDLDRCPEDRVVEVLQAVHLLLAFPLFVVVMGVDSRWLLRSLEDHYAALRGGTRVNGGERISTPQNYLEKIFQIPFTLRRMDSGGFERLMDGSLTVRRAAKADPATGTDGFLAAANEQLREMSERTGDESDDPAGDEGEELAAIDLTPAGLEIEEWEMRYLQALHPLIGSPRSAKRFVNVYQFIRARLQGEELERFRGTEQGGEYQVAAILLAILIGFPRESTPIFKELEDRRGSRTWWTIAEEAATPRIGEKPLDEEERRRMGVALKAVKPVCSFVDSAAPFRNWAPLIKRFSFHSTT